MKYILTVLIVIFFINSVDCDLENNYKELISVKVSKKGLNFLTNAVERELKKRVKWLNFTEKVLTVRKDFPNLNLTISGDDGNLHHFQPPQAFIDLLPPNGVSLSIEGGYFDISGRVKVKMDTDSQYYRIIPIRELTGALRVKPEHGKHVRLNLDIETDVKNGDIIMNITHCKLDVSSLEISLNGFSTQSIIDGMKKMTTFLPALIGNWFEDILSRLDEYIKNAADGWIRDTFCKFAKKNVHRVFDRMPNPIPLGSSHQLKYSVLEMKMEETEILMKVGGDVRKSNGTNRSYIFELKKTKKTIGQKIKSIVPMKSFRKISSTAGKFASGESFRKMSSTVGKLASRESFRNMASNFGKSKSIKKSTYGKSNSDLCGTSTTKKEPIVRKTESMPNL